MKNSENLDAIFQSEWKTISLDFNVVHFNEIWLGYKQSGEIYIAKDFSNNEADWERVENIKLEIPKNIPSYQKTEHWSNTWITNKHFFILTDGTSYVTNNGKDWIEFNLPTVINGKNVKYERVLYFKDEFKFIGGHDFDYSYTSKGVIYDSTETSSSKTSIIQSTCDFKNFKEYRFLDKFPNLQIEPKNICCNMNVICAYADTTLANHDNGMLYSEDGITFEHVETIPNKIYSYCASSFANKLIIKSGNYSCHESDDGKKWNVITRNGSNEPFDAFCNQRNFSAYNKFGIGIICYQERRYSSSDFYRAALFRDIDDLKEIKMPTLRKSYSPEYEDRPFYFDGKTLVFNGFYCNFKFD